VGVAAGPEVAIMDAGGRLLPAGQMGEIVIRGENVTRGYENNPQANAEAFTDGWFRTGDAAMWLADGCLRFLGRYKDMLKVGGVFVAPSEIENCLLQHEAVLECAVVGHDGGDGLVKPKAFIVTRADHEAGEALAEEIKQFVKTHIAIYKYPRWIEFVPSLPKNDRGKIDRKKLKIQ
ncbi:MAG: class I adenylate-forming enzyme family protein, partial [Pyrinomonadaceae bacterium]